jgi:hypothetical protein
MVKTVHASQQVIYRAASGAKVLTIDRLAGTFTVATRQNGRREDHTISVEKLVKMAYGEKAVIIEVPDLSLN